MANWDNIINNHLTMGRSRWICYRLNEERRRQEQERREGRPGVRPVGNGWGNIQMENFYEYRILGRGTLMPRPFIQIHWGWCVLGCYREQQLDLVRSCMDQGKTMSDGTYQAHEKWDQPDEEWE